MPLHDCDPLLRVPGRSFVEFFSGSGSLTIALSWIQVPAMKPWDIGRGERWNVLRHGHVLVSLVEFEYVGGSHIATPCISVSWARQPQIRSLQEIYGIEKCKSHPRQGKQISEGNDLILWSAQYALCLHRHKCWFSIENPFPSWLWCFSEIRHLWTHQGVIHTLVTFQSFGTPWYKLAGVLHNLPLGHTMDIGESEIPATVQLR